MDQPANAIEKNTNGPSDKEDSCNNVKETSHDFDFLIVKLLHVKGINMGGCSK
jgi:hypothetical protein